MGGRRRRKVIYGDSKAAVRKKLKALNIEKDGGKLWQGGEVTLAKFIPAFIEYHKQNVKANTIREYNKAATANLIPIMGSMKLCDIRVRDVYDMHAKIDKPGARKQAHALLSVALSHAAKWDMIPGNPAIMAKPPKVAKSKVTVFSREELQRLFDSAKGTKYHALFVTAATTGMRQGELFGLQWKHIDLVNAAIMVEQSLTECDGKVEINGPKTFGSRRRIDLPAACCQLLKDLWANLSPQERSRSSLVFTSPLGSPFRKSNFQRNVWKKALLKADIPYRKFHSLRHSMASLLLAENVNPKVVQERMGHKNIQITLDTYSHMIPTIQADAARRFDGMFT